MKPILRVTMLATAVLVPCLSAAAAFEFRGLFVDAFHPGFKTHEQVTQMVDAAKAANFKALIVQVRKRGDAYYNSGVEPKAADIAADYDPLADVIQQGHAAGLEVHAWLTACKVMQDSKWYNPPPTHVCKAHPEWLTSAMDGRTTFDQGAIYLDPGVPQAEDHLVSVVLDVVERYDADGIHLEDIRYPGPDSGYNAAAVELFNQAHGRTGLPDPNDRAWREWRRNQVTNLVRTVRDTVSSIRPRARLSASVLLARADLASGCFLQDWEAWTRDGIVDFVIPMLYFAGESMTPEAADALSASHDRHVYVGIGGYRIPPALACGQIEEARAAGGKGVALYSYHYLGPNSPQAACVKTADLAATVFAEPASLPAMPWR